MTSKLIVNSLAADTGVSTITFADQAKMGNAIFHSTGFTIGDSFLHSTGVNITNINATGVITATKFVGEVSVGSSITFEDNEKAYFGTGTDFSIYHNGSASYLDETGTGGLIAKTNTAFQVFNSAGSQAALTVTPGGAVELYHNTTKVLETKGYGIDITGGFIQTGNSIINDNGKLQFGNAADLQIFHDGSHSRIYNSTGTLSVRSAVFDVLNTDGSERMLKATADAGCELFFNGDLKLQTRNTDTVFYDDIRLGDNHKVNVGTLDDMQLYHDGTFSYIAAPNNHEIHINASSGGTTENMAKFKPNGAVELYHNGTKRFETSNTGVLLENHSYSIITGAMGSTENIKITNTTSGGYIQIGLQQQDSDGLHHRAIIKASKGGAGIAGKLELLARGSGGGTNRGWIIDAAVGIQANQQVLPESDNTYDLGSSTKRWNDLYLSGGLRVGGTGTNNELDDYEEGSFSPTLVNGNNGYRFQQGTYTKVGNLVSFTAYIETSATPPSGNLAFGNLPFTSIGSRNWVFPFHTNRTSFGTASFDARAYMGGSDTNIYIYYPVNSSSSNFQPINQNGMNAANASAVWISGSYQTSA